MLQTVKEFKRSYEENMKTKFVRHLDKEKLKVKFVKQLEEEEKADFVIETAGDSSFFEDVHKVKRCNVVQFHIEALPDKSSLDAREW